MVTQIKEGKFLFTVWLFLSDKRGNFCKAQLKINVYFVVVIGLYLYFVIVKLTIQKQFLTTVTAECSKLNMFIFMCQ